jgi:phosphoadenosine phosphosulfate reductase
MNVNQLVPTVRAVVMKPFSEKLERAEHLIRLWSREQCVVSCSFGKDSVAVLHLVRKYKPNVRVLFQNTGVEFPETLRLKEQLIRDWNLEIIETKPKETFWQVMDRVKRLHLHVDDGKKHSNVCCNALKHGPARVALKDFKVRVNFTGMTAMESRNRMFTACHKGMEYYSSHLGVITVHPIMFWRPDEVFGYIKENGIPLNVAYERYGLQRVGCQTCTSYKGWREQIGKRNLKLAKYITERYFDEW